MVFRLLNTVVLVAGLFWLVSAAYGQKRVKSHYQELKKIQDEINSVKKEIAANKEKESSVLFILANLDLDIDLTQSLLQKLRREQKQTEKKIATIEENLRTTEKELRTLLDIMGRRLVYFYKYGRYKDIELLLTAKSLNQGLLWVEYQKRLSDHDYRNYVKIKEKKASIAHNRDSLAQQLKQKQKLIAEKLSEEQKLKRKKQERQKVLASIRRNTDLYRQQLAEKERARAEMLNLIASIERAPSKPLVPPDTPFSQLQGRMMWPTKGKVVAKFGKYKHPQLKTITENIGIDIAAEIGTPVQVVAAGRVTRITWQRGMGNIVIVKHYGGYYTAYTHLREILVNEFQDVQMGDVIGTVGESGSLDGPRLHFEIYKGTEAIDPEKWLAVQS